MKKRNKRMKGLRAIALAALCFSVRGQPDIYAAETKHPNVITENLFTTVTKPANQITRQMGAYALVMPNGEAAGTGVRLSIKPSLSATILALMYNEEQVSVNGVLMITNSDGT